MTVTLILAGLVLIGIGQWGWRHVSAALAGQGGRTDTLLRQRVGVLRRGAAACHVMGALLIVVAVVPFL